MPLLTLLWGGAWLWQETRLGLAETRPRTQAASAPPSAAASASAAPRRLEPVYVPQVVVPAMLSLPALGDELASAFIAVLREANLDARAGSASASGSSKGDADSMVVMRLEAAGGERVRLAATWRGTSVNAVGDLEHLDDLVYALFEQLRSRLLTEVAALTPTLAVPVAASVTGNSAERPAAMAAPSLPRKPGNAQGPVKPADKPVVKPIAQPLPHSGALTKPAAGAADSKKPADKSPPASPPSTPGLPAPAPVVPAPSAEPAPAVSRPRVAVHVVGEPSFSPPPALYGLGMAAQQILVQYLQMRLRVTPVPSRLVGLVGGLEALTQSLRLGARHTLMARFDTLTDGYGAYGARVLSGRLHLVLLLDSRPLFDRSLALPPTAYYPTEAPAVVLGRLLGGALDGVASELQARLNAAPSQ